MTAENPEPNDASSDDTLRARYLPVSRKELRRQREAELAQSRRRKPRAGRPPVAESPAAQDAADAGDAAAASRAADLESGAAPAFTTGSEPTSGPSSSTSPTAAWEFSLPAPSTAQAAPVSAPEAAAEADLTEPATGREEELLETEAEAPLEDQPETEPAEKEAAAEEPVAPEESAVAEEPEEEDAVAEAEEAAAPEGEATEAAEVFEEEASEAEVSEEEVPEPERSEEEVPEPEATEATEDTEVPDDVELSLQEVQDTDSESELIGSKPQDLPGTELDDLDDAPIPASRKSRRSLRVSENIAELSDGKLEELQEITEALAATDDPHRVDPELLKKQQALAARAMQANQERRRQEQVEADREARDPRRRLRPESEVITRKTLRAHTESDEPAERTDHPTGSIEPIHARGAHGLEIDAMVEHSTRQGARQSMIGWLVIILAVLLIVAVGVVLSFIL